MPLIKIVDSSIEFACAANDTITRAALRAGLGMPYECNVGSCGEGGVHIRSPRHVDTEIEVISSAERSQAITQHRTEI